MKKLPSPAQATTANPGKRKRTPPAKSQKSSAHGDDIFDLIGKSQNIEEAAMAMQAMAHPLRIKVLCLLSSGEVSVQEIVEAVGTTQGNVSQHLAILRANGMVTSRNEGTRIYYRIDDPRVVKLISLTRDMFCSI